MREKKNRIYCVSLRERERNLCWKDIYVFLTRNNNNNNNNNRIFAKCAKWEQMNVRTWRERDEIS